MNATATRTAAPTAAELGINPTGERFYAARAAGRYRVFEVLEDGTHIERAVAASRSKAEERAAKLNAEAAPVTAPLEVVTLDGEDATVEVTPTSAQDEDARVLADAIGSGAVSFDSAVSAILSGASLKDAAAPAAPAPVTPEQVRTSPVFAGLSEDAREQIAKAAAEIEAVASANAAKPAKAKKAPKAAGEKAPARKADPTTRAMWIVVRIVPMILEGTDPAAASIREKLAAAKPNSQGGRTVRLTAEEATTLAGIATELETAALDEKAEVERRGSLAHSCASMRARATALWA